MKKKKINVVKFCKKCNTKFEVTRTIEKNGKENIPKKEKTHCSRNCANSHIQTKEQNEARQKKLATRQKKYCKKCGKEIKFESTIGYCKTHIGESLKYRKNLSKSLKGKSGGFRKYGGRGKSGNYKGYFCQSSWELAYVIYNLEHNIKFKRSWERFSYTFNGKKRNYIPDFKLDNGDYVEVKGYWSEQWQAKKDSFPHKLIVIDKKGIVPYIDYVKIKYGKDFIKLYE